MSERIYFKELYKILIIVTYLLKRIHENYNTNMYHYSVIPIVNAEVFSTEYSFSPLAMKIMLFPF